ncbi:MAG: hypothetical protein K6G08_10085 [Prevotella sp.]|nr:hypothetical protein [Prevotella sp.]
MISSGTCANLVLTDGEPFKAPAAFTAEKATFTKTVSGAGYATMVIPFDAELPVGVTDAKNLTGVDGERLISTDAISITADKPVMIKAAAGDYEFTATNAAIGATADGLVPNGLLQGTYATTTAAVSANNYVLQKNGDDVNFYLVTGTPATVKPFRAYLNAPAGPARLFFDFDETNSINLAPATAAMNEGSIYTLSGQRVEKATKGLYIVNGKKVVVK